MESLKKLKEELKTAFGGSVPKVLVFVDELDRCRPDYAVSFLETIKHVFDIPGMVFMLAVDQTQLAHSVKALYGDIDFHEYFRKFSHRTFVFPEREEKHNAKLVNTYVKRYLRVEGKRMSLLAHGRDIERPLTDLVHWLRMRPRQVQEAFRILGHSMQTNDPREDGNGFWQLSVATIVLSCIRVSRPALFDNLRQGDEGIKELCRLLINLLGKEQAAWWVKVLLSLSSSENHNDFREEFLLKQGYVNIHTDMRNFLAEVIDARLIGHGRLRKIAIRIEQIRLN